MVKKLAAPTLCVVLMALTAVSFVASLTFGSVDYNNAQVWEVVQAHLQGGKGPNQAVDSIVWELRAPRGVLALIVGAGLSLAGVAMQTLVRNPLADPYLLGVSSGASVGATAVLTFGLFSSLGLYALSGGALIGALVATATVYAITMAQGGLTPLRLILSGVVLSSAFSALASFLVFKGPDARAAQGVMFWMLGSVAGGQWNKLLLPAEGCVGCGAGYCGCSGGSRGVATAGAVFHSGPAGGGDGGHCGWYWFCGLGDSASCANDGGVTTPATTADRCRARRIVCAVGGRDRADFGTPARNSTGCGYRRAGCAAVSAAHGA